MEIPGILPFHGDGMPLKITNIRLPVEEPESALKSALAERLRVKPEELTSWRILRKSLDARSRSHLKFVYSAMVEMADEEGRFSKLKAAVLFATDRVYWTESIATAAQNYAARASDAENGAGEVWLLGSASDRTMAELSQLGFAVHVDVRSMMAAPPD